MPQFMTIMVGFSVGISALLGIALFSAYRKVAIPWQSRAAGLVMLIGLALTQLGNADLLLQGAEQAPERIYVAILFVQSWGFYWLLFGVLRPADRWRRIEWGLPAVVLAAAWLVPARMGIAASLAMGTLFAIHLSILLYRLRAMRRWFKLGLPIVVCFGLHLSERQTPVKSPN